MGPFKTTRLCVKEGTYYRAFQSQLVFPFDRNTIKILVPEDIMIGNYRIGVIEDDRFLVKYVGRTTDQTLQERLLQHKKPADEHYYDDNYYFFFSAANSEEEAVKQECIDFHSFGGDVVLDNSIHPSLSDGTPCPWQGCNHEGGE